jgi:enoyl-CoA hydratase/carnithine racemase
MTRHNATATPSTTATTTDKVIYEKRGPVAWITLNRPEVRNAIDIETHERLCEVWTDFRDDDDLRVAVITGADNTFTSGADLRTHAPEWQRVGPMVGRDRLEDGVSGITRGPLASITKPIIAAIDGWCVGHGIELAMACDLRIATDRAQFGTFEVRRGMHPADGGIVRLVNTCGVGFAMELLLTGDPVTAERAYAANMLTKVVPAERLVEETERVVQAILRCDRTAVESAKETVLEIIGRPLHDQLRVEAMWGYALCAGNPSVMGRSQDFFDRTDAGRAGTTPTPLPPAGDTVGRVTS